MFRLSAVFIAGVGALFIVLTGLWVPIVRSMPRQDWGVLAFSATLEGSHVSNVYILDMRTGIISQEAKGSSPSWSPDGQQVAYVKYQEYSAAFYTTDPIMRHTTHEVTYSLYPPNRVWSPDRQRISLMISARKTNYFITDRKDYLDLIRHMRVDERYIDWTDNGNKVVFAAAPSGYRNIYTLDLRTQELFQVTHTKASDFAPTWSPDGKQIAFISTRNYRPEIFVVNADSSGEKLVSYSPLNDYVSYMLAWSSDGKQISYYSTNQRSFYLLDAEGSEARKLMTLPGFVVNYSDWRNG